MNQDEIIAMAKEAGFDMSNLPSIRAANVYGEVNDELARFADLVAAKEREACAQVCDASVKEWLRLDGSHHELTEAQMLADEIRARGQKESA